jgi:hypothetical protein
MSALVQKKYTHPTANADQRRDGALKYSKQHHCGDSKDRPVDEDIHSVDASDVSEAIDPEHIRKLAM